ASAERASEHPLGDAIVRAAKAKGLPLADTTSFQSLTGRGLEATVDGQVILIGSPKLFEERGIEIGNLSEELIQLESDGQTAIVAAENGIAIGVVAVADTIKSGSQEAVAKLKEMGLEVAMITGDNRRTADAVAQQVGIDRVLAEVLPDRKAEEVKSLQSQRK